MVHLVQRVSTQPYSPLSSAPVNMVDLVTLKNFCGGAATMVRPTMVRLSLALV